MSPEVLHFAVIAPIGFAAIGALCVLLWEMRLSRRQSFLGRRATPRLVGSLLSGASMGFLMLACFVASQWFASGEVLAFNPARPMLQLDPYSALATALLAGTLLLCCVLSVHYLGLQSIDHGEYFALVLLSAAGMFTAVASVDFVALFVGLELMSLPLYALAGFDEKRLRANEAALKLFVTGAFASGLLLYGVALLYGATGTTAFAEVRAAFEPGSVLSLCGLGLVVVGLVFKVATVPFHQWAPDVIEGAPASVSALLAVAVKVAGVFVLFRVLAFAVGALGLSLVHVLGVLAASSMLVGSLMAVIQGNVKRMLAYSGIAQVGALLLGLVAGTLEAYAAVVFGLVVYAFMTLGAFAIVVVLAERDREFERISAFAGLAHSRPGLAALMTLFLLSLAGFPLTAGFFAKFALIRAIVNAGFVPLAGLALLAMAIAVYPYLRIPVQMYMRERDEFESEPSRSQTGERIVLAVCAAVVVALGVLPDGGRLIDARLGEQVLRIELPPVSTWAQKAAAVLLP